MTQSQTPQYPTGNEEGGTPAMKKENMPETKTGVMSIVHHEEHEEQKNHVNTVHHFGKK